MKIKSVVMPLIGINVVAFILQMMFNPDFTVSFMLISKDVFTRPWILLTHMFLHANPNHIFFNMYGLLIFGPLLEQKLGPKRFLMIYLLSGILAGFFSSFFYQSALGASGAIMGMLGVLIILMPDLKLLFLFFIPMSLRTAGIIWTIMDIFGIFVPNGVGNIAHLVGLGTGLIYGFYLKKQKKKYYRKSFNKEHITIDELEDYFEYGRI